MGPELACLEVTAGETMMQMMMTMMIMMMITIMMMMCDDKGKNPQNRNFYDDSILETARLEVATGEMPELISAAFHTRWPAT